MRKRESRGFLKVLVAIDSDRILRFMNFGVGAGEVTSAVQIAMMGGLPYITLSDAVLAHPTLVEGLHMLFTSTPSAPSETMAKEIPNIPENAVARQSVLVFPSGRKCMVRRLAARGKLEGEIVCANVFGL